MESPANILRKYLIDLGIAGSPTTTPVPAWPVITGASPPDKPDNFLALTDTGGENFMRQLRSGKRNLKPTIQIWLRGAGYMLAWNKCQEIEAALDKVGVDPSRGGVGWPTVVYGGKNYRLRKATVRVPASKIAEDDSRNPIFTMSVETSPPEEI